MSKFELNFEALFIKSLAGDKFAYANFLKVFANFLRKTLKSKIFNESDVEDVVQEILISVHKAKHTYSAERPLMPWLKSIIYYRLNDYLREYYRDKRNEKVQFDENFEIEDENFVTEASVESEDIKVIIENLKEKQKNILNLMYFKEMSVRQVASELKISESDVKVTAHRAYKIIREKILKKNGKN